MSILIILTKLKLQLGSAVLDLMETMEFVDCAPYGIETGIAGSVLLTALQLVFIGGGECR